MKTITTILCIAFASLAPLSGVWAQASAPAAGAAKSSASTSGTAAARTDVYYVHFTKAALGKAAELGDWLKTSDPNAPMPGHVLVLRHQDGDAWDYVAIAHLGTKATVEARGKPIPKDKRDLSEWHTDTFVNGPSWSEFTKQMGISEGTTAKSADSVYAVSIYRAAPGHRDELEKMLSEAPNRQIDTTSGNILMQHLDGASWQYLVIARYNSWQDFATNEKNSVAQSRKKEGGWFQLRDQVAFHTDTLTDRIAP